MGRDDSDSDDDTYVYYGTPLQDEQPQGPSRDKAPQDPTQTRALPVHQQEVTDEQGRRRFHGAFTGGFSAGYYNTEGFTPATFKSSRTARAGAGDQQQQQEQGQQQQQQGQQGQQQGQQGQHDLDFFLDEDEKEERGRLALALAPDYDTFGDAAAQAARARAAAEAAGTARPQIIPGGVIDELVAPAAAGVGVRLLQKMGWRQGRGVGAASAAPAGGKWGAVAGVGVENTPMV
ncbi:putative G patch domain-containing protein 1 like protein [Monoraphidium neglectum]|uniref:Putative G patch domain-containing protein 1 like protein n=1 Tax=Monoraphidium neglectum TaxID=145388 RepID=A0A0D2K332_9CHLO|nr:putative G patch domain-containing protein 1 like protein [Monoraphidium neglectum]KIZ04923.1 putative G patch domain-containing protein 1 like protein [Monoraphidium neglectum]|eukprot:XP_013903942.1 putative G patch domain-containing protein 1 like protein [Monoraphidium neglectum]